LELEIELIKRCSECGNENMTENRYCGKCGYLLDRILPSWWDRPRLKEVAD